MTTATRLFVGNLPEKVNDIELKTAFSNFGEVTTIDVKNKSAVENDKKLFAFVTLLASNYDVESCIKHFANENFNGSKLYVTRARESFLERLQREREQTQKKEIEKVLTDSKDVVVELRNEPLKTDFIPKPLNININSYKRKYESQTGNNDDVIEKKFKKKFDKEHNSIPEPKENGFEIKTKKKFDNEYKSMAGEKIQNKGVHTGDAYIEKDPKKQNSDKKRLDSMKKKRQEFNEKKMIIKTGLTGIDKAPNKKVIFSDNEDDLTPHHRIPIENNTINIVNNTENKMKRKLFDEGDDSDNDVNFEVKKQFEGKHGQKVLDLQSRYKADKRFVLDERFIEDGKSDEEPSKSDNNDEDVELGQDDEKYKQLNILQDVMGVPIKAKQTQDHGKQAKTKLGMLRFDPTQPEHAKFLAPVTTKQEQAKKSKKKKSEETPEEKHEEPKEVEKVEVSKEQFYKVSETLKSAMTQPNSFSLRSLFGKENSAKDDDKEMSEQNHEYKIPQIKEKTVKNPLDPGEKNPFVYDSSDSENEEDSKVKIDAVPQINEPKPVWRENLFFSQTDDRLKGKQHFYRLLKGAEGLLFFTQSNVEKAQKDRRELKSVMKKRVYNKERKNQMFQKKIGGRRRGAKKNLRKKS